MASPWEIPDGGAEGPRRRARRLDRAPRRRGGGVREAPAPPPERASRGRAALWPAARGGGARPPAPGPGQASAGEGAGPPPRAGAYEPLSAAKKKQIAKRAAKIEKTKTSF